MQRLRNPVRNYAWGSLTAIPDLLGEAPDGEPHAELWLGAHPDDPSCVEQDGVAAGLDEVIERDPRHWLGRPGDAVEPDASANHRLPFLMKVLAAGQPLSLQVHPSLTQARVGFADEDARGLARDAADRAYPDDNHKPEMLCALTTFRLAAGYRPAAEIGPLLGSLCIAELAMDAAILRHDDEVESLRLVLARWLRLSALEAAVLVEEVAAAAARELSHGTPYERELRNVSDLAQRYPGDIGVVVTLLLHHLDLAPGEAVFSAAGALHTYLSGTAVEIMACSDNVVRVGLTAKHVDVAAVLELVDITPGPPPIVTPRRERAGIDVYDVPLDDFRLSRVTVTSSAAVHLAAGRPQILLVVDGHVHATSGHEQIELSKGGSIVVAAADPAVELAGHGVLYRATTGG